jgi:hypothetical protein
MVKKDRKALIDLIHVYEELLEYIWQRVSGIVGELTLELIVKTSKKRLLPAFKFLEHIEISPDGIYLNKLKNNMEEEEIDNILYENIKKGLQALLCEILTLFTIMWGDIIIREVSSEIKKIEDKLTSS